jgi:hypothetical protein
MPQVAVAAIVAGVSASFAVGATIASVLTAMGIAAALNTLSYALTPKPKRSGGSALTNKPGSVAVRQSDLTHTHVYGHTRAVRGYAEITSTDTNKNLHMIIILCQGELRAINEIWLNDYAIPNDWLDADGNVTQGRYANNLQIRKHTGAVDQIADPVAVANIPEWTSTDRLQGVAYLYIKMIKDQDVYPNGVPNVSAVVEGPVLFDPRYGNVWSTNLALFARDFILSQDYGYGASFEDIDDTNIVAELNISDEMVTVVSKNFTSTAVNTTLNLITLEGDILPLEFGDRITVSTSGTLPSGLSAATNYFVIPYQVKDTPRIGLATTLQNAMNKVYIDITSAGSGTLTVTKNAEPRYHGGGVFDTEANLSDTLSKIMASAAGRAYPIGGAWSILTGAWRAPTLEFTVDDIRGDGISWKNGLSLSESYNVVKGTFAGPSTYYQDTDYPFAKYFAFISADNGQESVRNLDLDYMTRSTGAQRVAKIELFRGRQGISVSATFSTKAMQVQPGDVIMLTIPRYGWSQKYFEVTTFAFDATTDGLFCKLELRETAEAIYNWGSGEAIDYDPAPNTTLTSPFDVSVPTSVSYNSRFIETSGGDNLYTLQLQWDNHPDAFVREFGDFEIQFKKSADSAWLPSFFVEGNLTASDIVTASNNTPYDLRIRARNSLGVRSGWVTLLEAIAGTSGGTLVTNDWGSVATAPTVFNDWGSVDAAVVTSNDWEYVV